jgi:hypothetical protein
MHTLRRKNKQRIASAHGCGYVAIIEGRRTVGNRKPAKIKIKIKWREISDQPKTRSKTLIQSMCNMFHTICPTPYETDI